MIDWLLQFFLLALVLLALVLAAYIIVHRYFPGWGTKFINLAMALPGLLLPFWETLPGLPWAQILKPQTLGAVIFALAVGNTIIKVIRDRRHAAKAGA